MLGYKKRQQAIRKEVLNSIFDKPLLDTIQNERNIKEKEENLQTVKKKRFMEKVTISEGIDVLETDPDKKNKMKTSGFLLTLNTNKNKAVINTELLNVEDNDDGNYGYEEICKKLEVHVIKKLHKKSYFVPKLYGATIIEPLWDEIRDLIVQLHAEPGAWEESGEGNGRKIHIHITVRVMYSGMFLGFFHINTRKLAQSIRTHIPELSWGNGPYLMSRFIKEANLTVAQYIHKLKYTENIALYQRQAEKIAEYKEFIGE